MWGNGKNKDTSKKPLIEITGNLPELVVIWGKAGTGKTYYTKSLNNSITISGNQNYIDSYTNQEVIIMDGDLPKTSLMIEILDGEHIQKFMQQGARNNVKRVIIVHNQHPDQWSNEYQWLRERITEIINFD